MTYRHAALNDNEDVMTDFGVKNSLTFHNLFHLLQNFVGLELCSQVLESSMPACENNCREIYFVSCGPLAPLPIRSGPNLAGK